MDVQGRNRHMNMRVRSSRKHKAIEVICVCFLDEVSEVVKAGRKGVLEV